MSKIDALTSNTLDFDDSLAAIESFFERGWTDGLPIVPPTPEHVAEFLDRTNKLPGDTIAIVPTRRRRITAEKVAVNAVMAGCRPEHFKVVIGILEAMAEPSFNFHGSITSTGGSAQLVIVNGPVRLELQLNSGVNLFGPGNRANATIGRAVRLVLINVCGAVPGVLDQSTHGHGGKYSMVMAEDEERSPWSPLHVDLGHPPDSSAVTVFAAEAPHNVQDHFSSSAGSFLAGLAMEVASAGSWSTGQSVIVVAPEHARLLARDGWTRRNVQEYVYENATRTTEELRRAGKFTERTAAEFAADHVHHRGHGPDDILVVAGGGAAGGHSAFIPSWSRGRNSTFTTRTVTDDTVD